MEKKERQAERQWKQRTLKNRRTMETKENVRQKDSGNKEQHQAERQWKQRTTEGRTAEEEMDGNEVGLFSVA